MIGLIATGIRYAGLTLVALNIVMLWRWARQDSFVKKIWRSLIQLIPSAILLLWWRQHLGIGDSETNQRPLVWHPITLENLQEGLINLGAWILPISHQAMNGWVLMLCGVMGGMLLVGLLCFTLYELFRGTTHRVFPAPTSQLHDLTRIICIFSLGYLLFLVCVRSLFDPNIVLDPRTLAPIFLPLICALVASYNYIKEKRARLALIVLLLIIYTLPLKQVRHWLQISYFNGIELNDKRRLSSNLLTYLRACPKTAQVYADQPWNLNLEFKTMVYWLPTYHLYGSGLADPHYQTKIAQLPDQADLIVIEDSKHALIDNIERLKAFRQVYSASDGLVWQHIALERDICR